MCVKLLSVCASCAVYKCLLITTFNFKARAHRTSRGRETVVSAILNIVADTRTETGTHTHTDTHAQAFTHITCWATSAPTQECVLCRATSGPGSGPHCLLIVRLRGQSIYLLHRQARAVPKTPALSTRVPTCVPYALPLCSHQSPFHSPLFHSNLFSTLWRHYA